MAEFSRGVFYLAAALSPSFWLARSICQATKASWGAGIAMDGGGVTAERLATLAYSPAKSLSFGAGFPQGVQGKRGESVGESRCAANLFNINGLS